MNERPVHHDKDALIYIAIAGVGCLLAWIIGHALPQTFRAPLFVVAFGLALVLIRVFQPSNSFIPRLRLWDVLFAVMFVGSSVVVFEHPHWVRATREQVAVGLSLGGGVVLLVGLWRRGLKRPREMSQEQDDGGSD